MNFANSIPVETPDLVPMMDPPVQTYNVTDGGTGVVTTRIEDKDGIWRAGPSDIRVFEGAAESLNVKKIKKFDSSGRVNFANSIPVETPDLVPFRDPPVQT